MAESPNLPTKLNYIPPAASIAERSQPFNEFWSRFDTTKHDIVLISSHGRYEFVDKAGNPYVDISYVVPPNTYVIETLDVGRLCATTIDKPLWNLLQPTNRAKFIELLKLKTVLDKDSPEVQGIINYTNRVVEPGEYVDVLKNFILYLPGMTVPKRRLLFGGDIFYKSTKMHYKITYRGFGVYIFPANISDGAAFPKARDVVEAQFAEAGQNIKVQNIDQFLLKNENPKANLFRRMAKSTDYVTNETVVQHLVTDATPRIIIFSSCGEYGSSSDIRGRLNAMKALQLQRTAVYKTYDAGYTQFLFRKPIACASTPARYLNFVLEKGNSSVPNNSDPGKVNMTKVTTNNPVIVSKYRKIFFPKKENYEGDRMFVEQDFEINLFKNMLTPLEVVAFDESLNDPTMTAQFNEMKNGIKDDASLRQLYLDFLEHRAALWFENLHLYLEDNDNTYKGKFDAAYLSTVYEKIGKPNAKLSQEFKDILETIMLYNQMICWTLHLKRQLETNIDDLLNQFTTFRSDALKERAEKKAIANALAEQKKQDAIALAEQKRAQKQAEKNAAAAAAAAVATSPTKRPTRTPRFPVQSKPRLTRAAAASKKVGGTRRKTQKKLKRTLKLKRHNRVLY